MKTRENKNFSLADDLRKQLINLGVEIQDDPKGVKMEMVELKMEQKMKKNILIIFPTVKV